MRKSAIFQHQKHGLDLVQEMTLERLRAEVRELEIQIRMLPLEDDNVLTLVEQTEELRDQIAGRR